MDGDGKKSMSSTLADEEVAVKSVEPQLPSSEEETKENTTPSVIKDSKLRNSGGYSAGPGARNSRFGFLKGFSSVSNESGSGPARSLEAQHSVNDLQIEIGEGSNDITSPKHRASSGDDSTRKGYDNNRSVKSSFQDLYWVIFEGDKATFEQYIVWGVSTAFSLLLIALVYVLQDDVAKHHGTSSGLLFGSLGTLISTAVVIILFLAVPEYKKHMNVMLFHRSCADFCLALTFILQPIWRPEGVAHETIIAGSCKWSSVMREYFFMCSFSWGFFFAYDLYTSLRNPFTSSKMNRKKYFVLSVLMAFFAAVTMSLSDEFYGISPGGFCWIKSSNPKNEGRLFSFIISSWLFVFIPVVIVLGMNMYATIDAVKRLHSGLQATMTIRKNMVRQGVITTMSFTIYWIVIWGLYVFLWLMNGADALEQAFGFLLTYRGILDFGLWFLYNKPTTDVFHPERHNLENKGIDEEDALLNPQANIALQKEIVFFTTSGIQRAVQSAQTKYGSSTTEQPIDGDGVCDNSSTSRVSVFTVDAPEGLHRTTLMEQKRSSRSVLSSFSPNVSPIPEEDELHLPSPMVTSVPPLPSMATAIQAENSTTQSQSQSPRPATFVGGSCRFRDYKPSAFYRLRTHFGITTDEYVKSFMNCSQPKISEGASGAFMFFTGDSSYIVKSLTTEERDFLITIADEYAEYMISNPNTFLTRFLGCYSMHFYNQECSFAVMENLFDVDEGVKVHLRYDIKGSWVNRNAKPPKIGKQIRCRHCNLMYICGEKSQCSNRVGVHEANVVLKDMDLTTKIRLGRELGEDTVKQLKQDSNFLCQLGIMDYSLLLGVVEVSYEVNPTLACVRDHEGTLPHIRSPSSSIISSSPTIPTAAAAAAQDSFSSSSSSSKHAQSTLRSSSIYTLKSLQSSDSSIRSSVKYDRSFFKQSNVGLRPTECVVGPGFYYIGIIDMLQQWNFSKRVENFTKTTLMRKDPYGISAIPPVPYKDRFQKKLDDIMYLGSTRATTKNDQPSKITVLQAVGTEAGLTEDSFQLSPLKDPQLSNSVCSS